MFRDPDARWQAPCPGLLEQTVAHPGDLEVIDLHPTLKSATDGGVIAVDFRDVIPLAPGDDF